MKRKIISYSPTLYSFVCFILNLVLSAFLVFLSFLRFNQIGNAFLVGLAWCIFLWLGFSMYRFLMGKYPINTRWFFINSATATSQSFIDYHKDQKTKELENAFKILKIFGIFTSWFWILALVYKKDEQFNKLMDAFKSFIKINSKIYRLIDIEEFAKKLPPVFIDYILVEI